MKNRSTAQGQTISTVGLALAILIMALAGDALAWRSALYPEDWTPERRDANGHFLHDFSYAGYHSGELPIPDVIPGIFVDVTAAPYDADNNGAIDVTAALQQAIDDVGDAGGGVVYLPAGTYRISRAPDANHVLWIGHSGVVLRGAGPGQTFILNTTTDMRHAHLLRVASRENFYTWYRYQNEVRTLSADVPEPTVDIFVADTSGYAAGDWVAVGADVTAEFIADHGMTGTWTTEDTKGPILYRQLVEIDHDSGRLRLDAPTRYPLWIRDGARLSRIREHIAEVGVEDLAVGNLENTTGGTSDGDYEVPGTGAYEMHGGYVIFINHVVDGWVRNVHSFRSAENFDDVHLLSGGVRADFCRRVTVDSVVMSRPQYRGAGGNGYLFVLTGNDCLITNSLGDRGRHNFTSFFMSATGNVIHRSTARDGRISVDFHQRLAAANLIDNLTLDNDFIEAIFRDCCGHGHSATENVIWNTRGERYPSDQWLFQYIIESQQYETGYVIGTQGPASKIYLGFGLNGTAPLDFSEGIGEGETLEPESLYEDQLARRLEEWIEPEPDGGPDLLEDGGPMGDDVGGGDVMSGDHDAVAGDPSFSSGDTQLGIADTPITNDPGQDPTTNPTAGPSEPRSPQGGCGATPAPAAVLFFVLILCLRPE